MSLPTSGSYLIQLSNTAAGGSLRGSIVADTGSVLVITALLSVVGGGANASINYTVPAGATSVMLVITNENKTGDDPEPPNACVDRTYKEGLLMRPSFFYHFQVGKK